MKKLSFLSLTMLATLTVANAQNRDNKKIETPLTNPFFATSKLHMQAPAFDKIKTADFLPAIEAGISQQRAEIEKIANNKTTPTFQNTLVAMEKSGQLLGRV